jgi:hypothetical protein
MAGNARFGRGPAGAAGAVGPAGPAGPPGDAWTKFTILYNDFISGSGTVVFAMLTAKRVVENAILKTSIAFAGAEKSNVRLIVVPSGDLEIVLLEPFDLKTVVAGNNLATSQFLYAGNLSASQVTLKLVLDTGESVPAELVAGSLDIWLKISPLP